MKGKLTSIRDDIYSDGKRTRRVSFEIAGYKIFNKSEFKDSPFKDLTNADLGKDIELTI